ncbi:amidohydrolase [Sporocytophaga myxococcoides]|uniref:amidohydrolase n=1 Tax=Sporocytophaga myxococcoides TaxID=153721 RepID=UPI000406EEA8|nr:amidohydrolase [Sporocytophaga myxococcoides]
MQDLKITLVQTPLFWKNSGANLAMLEEKLWQMKEQSDLIILPEMFTTGFSMDAAELAEPMNLTAFKWMKQMAAQKKAVITGSVIIKEGDKFHNRLIWMEPDGSFDAYDKRHLFRMAGEDKVYTAGIKKLIKEIKGWKICPLVCYDLRFPVFSRNRQNEYDLLIYVANWPAARNVAWKTLLRARAIENISYVAGVNRIGTDGKDLEYSGDSAVIGPVGEYIEELNDREELKTITLSAEHLNAFRQKFPAHLDADSFELEL